LVVEHRLVDRDRQRLLRAEPDRVRELFLIGDARDVERADTDAIVGDPEAHALLRQLVLGEELLQRFGERGGVAQLSAHDDPGLERLARDLQQLRSAVVRNTRGCELRRADLQADEALRALGAAGRLDLRLLLLALLRFGLLGSLLAFLAVAERELLLPERNLLR